MIRQIKNGQHLTVFALFAANGYLRDVRPRVLRYCAPNDFGRGPNQVRNCGAGVWFLGEKCRVRSAGLDQV